MKGPADVVAILDSDVSSVSDSVNSPDPANVLKTQRGSFTLGLTLHGCDLNVPLSSCSLKLDALLSFTLLQHPSEPLI